MSATARIGRYEVLFRIAGGGMAEVFAARVRGEAGFEKLVALKRILPHLAEEESIANMFLDEARVAANIASPHVVQTLDMGRTDEGTPFLVMELVTGIDLAEMMKLVRRAGEQIPLEVAIEIFVQAAVGLHAAHEARTASGEPMKLVHRDVSPQNLLVDAEGRVRLTDFGIAWAAFERLTQTSDGVYKGKYSYFSPEQSRREKLDRRSDIFALGVVAWEVIAGRRLFVRDDIVETIQAIRSGVIPSLCDEREGVGPELDAVVRRALALDPNDRFSTARAFGDALRAAARAQGIEPSDAAVAELVRELEPPRLVALDQRLRQFAASPGVETLEDIESVKERAEPHTRVLGVRNSSSPVPDVDVLMGRAVTRRSPRTIVLAIAAVCVVAGGIGIGAALYDGDDDGGSASVTLPADDAPEVEAPARATSVATAPEPITPPPVAVAIDAGVAREPRAAARPRSPRARSGRAEGSRPLSVDAFDRGARRAH